MNEQDLQTREALRQARPVASGSRLSTTAVAGAAANAALTASSTLVDADDKVRRLWLVGDPWTDEFYFDWRPA